MTDNRVRIRADLDNNVSKGLGQMRHDFDATAKSTGAQTLLQGVGLGAGVSAWGLLDRAAAGVVDTIFDSIRAGSDLNETVSKTGVIFGDAADGVLTWGDATAETLGIAKRDALEAASGFAQLYLSADQTAESAADMSEKTVALAADLASFSNLDPADVLAKLRSGLVGESEPLRALGVFLNEDKVKAQALAMGLGDAHDELTDGDKILARYQIILDETQAAHGDFARTADGAANSQRILNAEMEDAKAKLGTELLPLEKAWIDVQRGVVHALSDNLTWSNYVAEAQQRLGTTSKGAEGKVMALAASLRFIDEANQDAAASTDLLDRHQGQAALSAAGLTSALLDQLGVTDALAAALNGLSEDQLTMTPKQLRRRNRLIRGVAGLGGHHQGGGFAPAETGFWAGEDGIEHVQLMPGGGAMVTAGGGSAPASQGGAAAPVVLYVQLDGATIARVVDRRLAWRQQRAGTG